MLARISGCLRRFFAFLRHHIAEALLPAVCVAAIVTLIHEHTHLFDSVDALVFTQIGNRASYQNLFDAKLAAGQPPNIKSPSATVISIDEDSYAGEYGEQTPLDRCQLLNHLHALYDAHPALLVIDIDLSPARWLRDAKQFESVPHCSAQPYVGQMSAECQAQCQTYLYETLKAPRSTTTLLMLPSGLEDVAEGKRSYQYKEWISSMEAAGVRLGEPSIIETLGLVLRISPKTDSIARLACMIMREKHPRWFCERSSEMEPAPWIDPRKYLNNISPLTISQFSEESKLTPNSLWGKAVFFGRAGDEDDMHLTPVGFVYGVEIHAASLLTLSDPLSEKHVLHFTADIFIALLFGIAIHICWRGYFHARFSGGDARQRLQAALYVLLLACIASALLLAAWKFSLYFFAHLGFWASPVQLAIGMLIEGGFTGVIAGAVHASLELTHEQSSRVNGLRDSMKRLDYDVMHLLNTVDDPDRGRARIKARMAKFEAEIAALETNKMVNTKVQYRKAAILLGGYRLLLIVLVAWCLATLFFPDA
jgi:hypothetical protein